MRIAGITENAWIVIYALIILCAIGIGIWEWLAG